MTVTETAEFTGKERDAETGLDYFGARYLSSAEGRFTSPDTSTTPQPVPYADFSDPQTLNLYNYMRNNPLSGVDPDGHCCQDLKDFFRGLVGGMYNATQDIRSASNAFASRVFRGDSNAGGTGDAQRAETGVSVESKITYSPLNKTEAAGAVIGAGVVVGGSERKAGKLSSRRRSVIFTHQAMCQTTTQLCVAV